MQARLERQDNEFSAKVQLLVVREQSVHRLIDVDAQSPVERGDYEGLQLDMREKKAFDNHQAWASSDKLKKELEGLQASPVATHGNHYYRSAGRPVLTEEEVAPDPKANERRLCGMRRRAFWIGFGIILAVIIIAAIIGGAVGGTRRHTTPPPATSPPPSPPLP